MMTVDLKELKVLVETLRGFADNSYYGLMREGFVSCCDKILEWINGKMDALDTEYSTKLGGE